MLVYTAAIAAIGIVSAAVVGWPVMFCLSFVMMTGAFIYQQSQGTTFGHAALIAVMCFVLLQGCYVVAGFVLAICTRGIGRTDGSPGDRGPAWLRLRPGLRSDNRLK